MAYGRNVASCDPLRFVHYSLYCVSQKEVDKTLADDYPKNKRFPELRMHSIKPYSDNFLSGKCQQNPP